GLPANGGFYFQAFDRSVALPVAGYNYNSVWTPLLTGLSPAGAASVAALVRPCSSPASTRNWLVGKNSFQVVGHDQRRLCQGVPGEDERRQNRRPASPRRFCAGLRRATSWRWRASPLSPARPPAEYFPPFPPPVLAS